MIFSVESLPYVSVRLGERRAVVRLFRVRRRDCDRACGYAERSVFVRYIVVERDVAHFRAALSFRIYEGETDVTANYTITVKKGTLSILKRKAQITTATLEKVYDGTPLSGDSVPERPVSGTNAAFASSPVWNPFRPSIPDTK